MKRTIEKVGSALKGVSTLDIFRKNPRVIWLLLISMTTLAGAIRGGHSTLDVVDPSFKPNIETLALSCKSLDEIIPLPDGKMLVAGTFNTYNRHPLTGGLVRLNADATLDTTFNSNLPGGAVKRMFVQADGKILIFALFPIQKLIRLMPDGSVDTTFDAQYSSERFSIDANGRIILAGPFFINGASKSVVRLSANGSLDSAFQSGLGSVFQITALAAQNNKVIVGYDNAPSAIQRLNEDGTIDSSFITRNIRVFEMIVQPDGKILYRNNFPPELRRLNLDGSDDTGFTTTAFTFPQYRQRAIALSNDGRIAFASGTGNDLTAKIIRFLPDGTVDSSFAPYIANGFNTLAVQADGGVLVGDSGSCPSQPFTNDFVRLFQNGSPDRTFDTGTGFQSFISSNVRAISIQPDRKILIVGNFHFVNNVARFQIARINPDSTLDSSFQINTSGTGNSFESISEFDYIGTQSDGKIIVSGSFSYRVNGVSRYGLVRLNSDGSIDATYILGIPVGSGAKIKVYPDGKVLTSNTSQGTITRLLATGELDPSFYSVLYPDKSVNINALDIQPDGKIIVGGWYVYGTEDHPYIFKSFLTRVNDDGSLDTTFQTREQNDKQIRAFVLLPNGKIVISESTLAGVNPSQSIVLRLNPDGTVDLTFNAGTGANGKVNAMLLLSTGRIFVGGRFANFNAQPRRNLVQLNEDGSVFTPVYSLNDEVLTIAVDSNGRVFVGGNFTTIVAGSSSANRSYVAGLIDRARFDFDGDGRADLATFSAADGRWSILSSRNRQNAWTNFGLSGDKTVAADYDGDGKTDFAVFRPSDATWWYLPQSTNVVRAVRWGASGDKPVAGDFDGDRKADFAVWRPSSADWWILKSSNGETSSLKFGLAGDLPLAYADFDGDRKTDIAVWRPSNGNFYWLASGSNSQFNAVHFGTNGDIPALADYNGDGKTDLVVYRPSEGNWYQYLSAPNGERQFTVINFGLEGDEPIPADHDGDGKTDVAVRRGNAWHILHSALGYSVQIFGNADAQAVATCSIQ